MLDILDVVKNLKTLSEGDTAFKVLKDFERVIDELDIYVYKNWEDGELVSGPNIHRHDVECKFMWPRNNMPDPEGAKRLYEYGCMVDYEKSNVLIPRKIKDPSDYRPGTKKGKIDQHPVWIVSIRMPKKLMQDVSIGKANRDLNDTTELMKYSQPQISSEMAAQEIPNEETTETPTQ
ncbi:hypothetical protein EB118_20855 [bacterium]|nr:hypothetical protein [Synechococcaceae bacterium WB6_1A_059]NDG32510.1 hypothetical protein [bacterium]NDG79906.1 hypothetical protein [Synechococcaceae bacterium WB8_1B_057]